EKEPVLDIQVSDIGGPPELRFDAPNPHYTPPVPQIFANVTSANKDPAFFANPNAYGNRAGSNACTSAASFARRNTPSVASITSSCNTARHHSGKSRRALAACNTTCSN